jgi:hypothetical protein
MRDERKVSDGDRGETLRLEELSDEDLEAVAGGCASKNGNNNHGLFLATLASEGKVNICP